MSPEAAGHSSRTSITPARRCPPRSSISSGPGGSKAARSTAITPQRGPGLHHIAIEVQGLDGALALLKALRVPLIDEIPRIGARGHRIAFIHPKATGGVLIELVEPVETSS